MVDDRAPTWVVDLDRDAADRFPSGMDSLAMLVSEGFGANPYDGGLYVFRSKRRDRVKIQTWDGSGLVLYYKRIEGQFTWPPIKEGVMPLSHAQLSVLLDYAC
ncbi:transposase [Bradyrhizobium diazoefficiens]|uniref:IS66 family insertion sequence element accessory protein TnpB n=2 Tax=Bradyrhizobium barranii subsp. barranii TaxID=2823807 RepID=A0A9X9Z8Y7_9BRAD|nr:IS66 family insertion sequence element accessory protein TnpB [Bradyrhizobium barranii]UGX99642.1 IS66 family insertion sequence element accessory protein TnpB [Bradyrhizobium barranii subsp. barranii]